MPCLKLTACLEGAGCFFRLKEEISRTREGRKGEEAPAAETLVFHLPPPPAPAHHQFSNTIALYQLTTLN